MNALVSSGCWTRIADDLRATAGRELVLRNRTNEEDADHGWLDVEVELDRRVLGQFGHSHSPEVETFVGSIGSVRRP